MKNNFVKSVTDGESLEGKFAIIFLNLSFKKANLKSQILMSFYKKKALIMSFCQNQTKNA